MQGIFQGLRLWFLTKGLMCGGQVSPAQQTEAPQPNLITWDVRHQQDEEHIWIVESS